MKNLISEFLLLLENFILIRSRREYILILLFCAFLGFFVLNLAIYESAKINFTNIQTQKEQVQNDLNAALNAFKIEINATKNNKITDINELKEQIKNAKEKLQIKERQKQAIKNSTPSLQRLLMGFGIDDFVLEENKINDENQEKTTQYSLIKIEANSDFNGLLNTIWALRSCFSILDLQNISIYPNENKLSFYIILNKYY